MSSVAKRRLVRDFKMLQDDPPAGVSGAPTDDNIMLWNAFISGPDNTPFEDGTFRLRLEFSEEYPNKPPKVKFLSKMFHPNIYSDGKVCMDLLKSRWSPSYRVSSLLTSIQSLLDEPNASRAANVHAGQLYQEDRQAYNKKIQSVVEESWKDCNS